MNGSGGNPRRLHPVAITFLLIGLLLVTAGAFVTYTVVKQRPDPQPSDDRTHAWDVDATSVGLLPLGLSCGALPAYDGESSVPRGTVISGVRVTTALDLSAGGIVLQNSCIQPDAVPRGLPVLTTQNTNTMQIAPEKVIIRNNEISGSLLTAEYAAMATGIMGNADVIGNYIHGFGSGIAVMNSGDELDVLIAGNYVTGLVAWGDGATTGNHSDAFTIRDFSSERRPDRSLIVRDNRFDCDSGNDTGALFIQTYSGRIDNVLVQGNLLEGNGYQLGLEQKNSPYSNLRAVNNRFSGTGWGPTYVTGGPGWDEWEANYLFDPASTDARGTEVPKP